MQGPFSPWESAEQMIRSEPDHLYTFLDIDVIEQWRQQPHRNMTGWDDHGDPNVVSGWCCRCYRRIVCDRIVGDALRIQHLLTPRICFYFCTPVFGHNSGSVVGRGCDDLAREYGIGCLDRTHHKDEQQGDRQSSFNGCGTGTLTTIGEFELPSFHGHKS